MCPGQSIRQEQEAQTRFRACTHGKNREHNNQFLVEHVSPGPDVRQEQETQIRFPGPPVARTGDTKRNGAFKPASGNNRKQKQISGPASKARTENTAMNHSHGSI